MSWFLTDFGAEGHCIVIAMDSLFAPAIRFKWHTRDPQRSSALLSIVSGPLMFGSRCQDRLGIETGQGVLVSIQHFRGRAPPYHAKLSHVARDS